MHNKYFYTMLLFILQLGVITLSANDMGVTDIAISGHNCTLQQAALSLGVRKSPDRAPPSCSREEIREIIDESLMEQQSYIDSLVRREMAGYKALIEQQRKEKRVLTKITIAQAIIIFIESIVGMFVIRQVCSSPAPKQ